LEHKHDTERAIVDLPSLASYTDYVQDERTRFESLVAEIVRSTATVVISTQVRRVGLRAPATPQNRATSLSLARTLTHSVFEPLRRRESTLSHVHIYLSASTPFSATLVPLLTQTQPSFLFPPSLPLFPPEYW